MKTSRLAGCALFAVLLLPWFAPSREELGAQQVPSRPAASQTLSYEGQNVSSVQIAGQINVDEKRLRPLITQAENAPYSQQAVQASAEALKQAGRFQDVKAEVRPGATGLQVLFVAQPALYFGIFDFDGATKVYTYPRLLQISDFPTQEPYTAGRVEEAQSALLTYFHRTGYFLATIEPQLQTDTVHGIVNVLFHIKLKQKAKFGNVTLEGASPEETTFLEKRLHSWLARVRGASLKAGKPYSLHKLETATTYLQAEMSKQHYLAGQARLVAANYDPRSNRAEITFKVTQGPKISVKTQGGRVWGRTMKKLVPVYQENSVDADLVQEGARNLASYFQAKGFFQANVQSHIEQRPSGSNIVYQIEKGRRGKVTSITARGNKHFEGDDLLAHAAVAKGNRFLFFSHGKYSEQLVRTSVKNLESVYRNAGYSHVKVTPSVSEERGKLKIAFQVDEGAQDIVDSLKIEGNAGLSAAELAPKGLNLEPGKPYSEQLLQKDRDQIMAAYLERGYLTASFKSTSRPLKNDPRRVTVEYAITEGPQLRTTMVDTLGAHVTRPRIIAHNAKIPIDKPLSETELLQSESQLYTLGVFDWANVDPQRPVTDNSGAEVLIRVHEAPRNSLTYGVGFEVINRGGSVPGGTIALPNLPPVGLPSSFKTSQSTFYGPRGSFQYSRLNMRGLGETLSLSGFAGRLDQRAAAGYTVPSVFNSIWTSNLTISGEHSSENPIFSANVGEAGYQVQRYLDAKRTKTLFLRYSLRRTNLTNLLIPDLVTPADRSERLSTLSASYIRDTRDNPLDAHRGIYESFDAAINPSVLGSNTNFGRLLGQTAYYHSVFGTSTVWANSLRVGFDQAFAGDRVPLSEEFFSGGGSTLRGFSLDGAGPQRTVPVCGNAADPATCSQIRVPVGGNQLVILNSELRFPIPIKTGLGGVFFYDGGNVYRTIGFQNFFGNYSNTLGLGLRYETPVGPVRIDIGHNLNPVSGIKATQIFITLGQAF